MANNTPAADLTWAENVAQFRAKIGQPARVQAPAYQPVIRYFDDTDDWSNPRDDAADQAYGRAIRW